MPLLYKMRYVIAITLLFPLVKWSYPLPGTCIVTMYLDKANDSVPALSNASQLQVTADAQSHKALRHTGDMAEEPYYSRILQNYRPEARAIGCVPGSP